MIRSGPLALLLALAGSPVLFLLFAGGERAARPEWPSVAASLAFASAGAFVATLAGAAAALLLGTRDAPARRALTWLCILPLAAPPAFWWLGLVRLPFLPGRSSAGLPAAALVAGIAYSPVAFLLTSAALREMPTNLYQSARVLLSPRRRVAFVLLPLLRPALSAGFLLTAVLLLGESEMPFLFGFRTLMTDVVTGFARSFDVSSVTPLTLPLVAAVSLLGGCAMRPLLRTVFPGLRGGQGIARTSGGVLLALLASTSAVFSLAALGGHAFAALGPAPEGRGLPIETSTVAVSIFEPVSCAWGTLLLAVAAAYPARGSRPLALFAISGLLLFCIPSAVLAIGWIGIGQKLLAGATVPLWLAYGSRAIGLALLGFAAAYARLPVSLERAARLVPLSPVRKAFALQLPVLAPSLAATALLIGALTFADRDVASLLLEPGASRLMLSLYLQSANAPAAVVGRLALATIAAAAVTGALAAGGPWLLWRRRG